MTPDRPPIAMHHIAAQTTMNRAAEKRRERQWLDAQRLAPEARYILIIDLKFAITSAPDRTRTCLRSFSARDLGELRVDLAEAYFLGIGDDDAPVFALALSPLDATALAGGPEAFAPLVDLRSLALSA